MGGGAAQGLVIDFLSDGSFHQVRSGITDNKFPNDQACLDHIRDLFDKIGAFEKAGFDRAESRSPKEKPEEIYGLVPADRVKPYDMHEIINRIIDNSEFDEYKALYGKTIVC